MPSDRSTSPSSSLSSEPPRPSGAAAVPAADDQIAAELRGFGPLGVVAVLAILLIGNVTVGGAAVLPVSALLVLLWTWRSRTPWRAIGYVRPRSWAGTLVLGVLFGMALKLAMKSLVMPLLGAPPINPRYHFLTGNRAMLPLAIWAMLVAGFAEETLFRGFLFERLGKLFGAGRGARVAIVLLTSMGFGLVHYADQGLAGVEQATVVGLLFGTIFAATGALPLLMFAHAAFDLTALALIYWNLEASVARLVFR